MKKYLTTALVVATPMLAQAQSSVTLYGVVDNAIEYTVGVPKGHVVQAVSGNWQPSVFGFLGTEDLGGGLKAIFRLETQFNAFTGATMSGSGSGFTRRSLLGLSDAKWGTVRLGYFGQEDIGSRIIFIDPQVFHFYGIATLVRGRNWTLTSNGIDYTTPTIGGLTFQGQYNLTNNSNWNTAPTNGLGSGPGMLGQAQGRSDGAQLIYTGVPNLQLRTIYSEIRDGKGQFSNVYTASRSIVFGGVYTMGALQFYAGGQYLSAPNASDAGYFSTTPKTYLPPGVTVPSAATHEWIGVAWDINPAVNLRGAIYHANANNGNGNATLYTLSGSYALSKRTLLYTQLGYVQNSQTSNIGLGNGLADPYGANSNDDPAKGFRSSGPNFGHGQFGAYSGIVTKF